MDGMDNPSFVDSWSVSELTTGLAAVVSQMGHCFTQRFLAAVCGGCPPRIDEVGPQGRSRLTLLAAPSPPLNFEKRKRPIFTCVRMESVSRPPLQSRRLSLHGHPSQASSPEMTEHPLLCQCQPGRAILKGLRVRISCSNKNRSASWQGGQMPLIFCESTAKEI